MNALRLTIRLMSVVMVSVLGTAFAPVTDQSLLFAQQLNADTSVVPRGMARVTWARALRAMRRGDTLRTEDFSLADTVIMWPWNTQPDSAAQAGWLVKRAFIAGEFMRAPSVAPLPVITTGSTVKVLWQDGGVRLTLSGVATNNAALGAPVGVRIDKNRRLDGIAVGANSVRLR